MTELALGPDDRVTIDRTPDGRLAVKIHDATGEKPARWLSVTHSDGDARERAYDELIWVLTELRDRAAEG